MKNYIIVKDPSTWYLNCNSEYDTITVKSLHQLQNIFFALTGEELNTQNLIK